MACTYDLDPSRSISFAEAADAWHRAGGSQATVIAAVAVAMAESALDPLATSTACAYGIWQILYTHAQENGWQPSYLYEIPVNAAEAVYLSGNGTDWGPWDVAYAEGENLTVRRHIPYPEEGSAANAFIPQVAAALGVTSGQGGGMPTQPLIGTSVGGRAPGTGAGPNTVPGVPAGAGSPQLGSAPGPFTIPQANAPYSALQGWDALRHLWAEDQAAARAQHENYQQRIASASGGVRWQG